MGFDAATALEPLSYTGLGEYGIPDGTVPEPSNDTLVAFLTQAEQLATLQGEPGAEVLARVHQAASDLCGGSITAEQFSNVPPRLFREFVKWLSSEFLDPKG